MDSPTFIGREAELRALQSAWADVSDGDPRFLVLVGDAGCGKTRLVQELYAWLSTESATNADGYWPSSLPITERPIALNPPPEVSRAPTGDDRRAIPWFWWGLGFSHERDAAESPITAGCALLQARATLKPHLQAWVHRASRGDLALDRGSPQWAAMQGLAKALEGLLPLLGFDPVAYATALDPAVIAKLLTLCRDEPAGASGDEDAGTEVAPDTRALARTLLDLFRALFRLGADGDEDGRALPCVLVLDDAQWADAETLAFVEDLYRDALAGNWPLMVLCTHASDGWQQAKQQAGAEAQRHGPRTLAAVCLRICETLTATSEGSQRPGCAATRPDEPWLHKPYPVFEPSPGSSTDNAREPQLCRELPLAPLSIDALRQILKQAVPGVTGVHAKKIMRPIGSAPAFLLDLIAYLAANDEVFVHGDPALGFSEDGIARVLGMIDRGHAALIDARFNHLKPEIQTLLGHASCQGPRFFTSLLLETGRRSQPGFAKMHLTLARVERAIVDEEPDLIGRFSHPAWLERGKGWLEDRQDAHTLRSTMLLILSEWFEQDALGTLRAIDRYDALRLLERELTRYLQSPNAEIDRYVSLEAVLSERERLETELGLPDRAKDTANRRTRVPDLLDQAEQAADRQGQVLTGHYGGITAIAWDPQERWVATGGGEGGEIIVWSVPTGRPIRQIQTKYGAARQLAVSPDGRCLLAIFHDSNEVSAWNPVTGKLRYCKTAHESNVQSLVVDPKGDWFATASAKWLHANDVETGDYRWGRKTEARQHHFRELSHLPSREWIASCGSRGMFSYDLENGSTQLWSVRRGRVNFYRQQRTLTASADGRWLAWAEFDDIRLLDMQSLESLKGSSWLERGEMQRPDIGDRTPMVYGLGFDPKGKWLAASSDGLVQIFSIPDGKLLRNILGECVHHDLWGPSFAVSPNGDWIATAGAGGKIDLLDPNGVQPARRLMGQRDWVLALAASPSGRMLAGAGLDSTLSVWDTATGAELLRTPIHRRPILGLAVAPDGSWIASAGRESVVRLWATTGEGEGDIQQRDMRSLAEENSVDRIEAIAASPDGRGIAIGKVRDKVRIWRLDTQDMDSLSDDFESGGDLIIIDEPVRVLITQSFGIAVRDLSKQEAPRCFEGFEGDDYWEFFQFYALAADRNARWIAAGGNMPSFRADQGMLWLWDLKADHRHCLIKGVDSKGVLIRCETVRERVGAMLKSRWKAKHRKAGEMFAVAFAGAGEWFASAGRSGKVWVWSPVPPKRRFVLEDPEQEGPVFALAAAHDDTWLASAGEDAKIRFWDIKKRRLQYACPAGIRPLRALAVDPQGRWLYSAGDDGLIRRWPLLDGLATEPRCDRAMQPLPDGEWVVWKDPDEKEKRRPVAQSAGADRWIGGAPEVD